MTRAKARFGIAALMAALASGCGDQARDAGVGEQTASRSDALSAVLQTKLVPSQGVFGGVSVAMSGDTLLYGGDGSAFVFVRNGGVWSEQARLFASDASSQDLPGYYVAVSGDTAVMTAMGKGDYQGAAYVFVRSGTTWSQQAKLTASDGAAQSYFGISAALSGDTAVIGAHMASGGKGAAYVFNRSNGVWSEQAKLTVTGAKPQDRFGWTAGISGDTAIVGVQEGGFDRRTAYVFVRNGSTWSQQAKLTTTHGQDFDRFGDSVAISGDTAVVGAWGDSGYVGAAYVFVRSGGAWSEQAKLLASDTAPNDFIGKSVSVSADTAVIGAPGANDQAGAAYVFYRVGTSWSILPKLALADGVSHDEHGHAVSASGATVVVTAPNVFNGSKGSGAAYVYELQKSKQGESCSYDQDCESGHCVDGVCCNNACGGGADDCLACSKAAGAASDGTCAVVADGSKCSDGNGCTQIDECQSGVCTGSDLKVCTAQDDCHLAGGCNPGTGDCSQPLKADGTTCDDQSACTSGDTCVAGKCAGKTTVVCPQADQCHEPAACEPASGTCPELTAKADGTGCDDGNPCTEADSCAAGKCVGGNPVTCEATDECHEPGVCDPSTGKCSNPAVSDGTACSGGVCKSGACSAVADAGQDGQAGAGGASDSGTGTDTGTGGGAQELRVDDAGGCGCRAAGGGRGSAWWLLFVLGAALRKAVRSPQARRRDRFCAIVPLRNATRTPQQSGRDTQSS